MAIITSLIDFIFPPRESELIIREATGNKTRLKVSIVTVHGTLCLCDYNDNLVRAAFLENKFHNNKKAALLLSEVIYNWCNKQSNQLLLVPIPLSNKRLLERGYNQVEKILNSLPRQPHVIIDTTLLKRTKHTAPQTTLKKSARHKNIKGAFAAHITDVHQYNSATVVIIDDVCTTGATLEEARATLAPLLPSTTKTILLALAH
jgi:ComF family protein